MFREILPKILCIADCEFAVCSQSFHPCLLYTSDAADDMQCVDLGGRRIIKKQMTCRGLS